MNLNGDLFIDVMNLLGNSWNVTKEDLVTYSPCIQQAAMDVAELRRTGKGPDGSSVLFPHLPYLLKEEVLISEEEKNALLSLKEKAKSYDAVISIGIGGSYLGNQVLFDLFCGPYWNQLTKDERNGYPQFYFAGQNVDPVSLVELFSCISREAGHIQGRRMQVLFLVISKSGTTIETVTAVRGLKKLLVDVCDIHLMAITDKEKGRIRPLAEERHFPCFTVPDGIGGRFSIFSQVGLVFASLAGIDIESFLKGAQMVEETCRSEEINENPALLLAALKYIATKEYGITAEVIMPYGDKLRSFGWWYAQLLGESLGKKYDMQGNVVYNGRIPVASVGTTDMHSLTQEHQQGQKNKLIQFISVEKLPQDLSVLCDEKGVSGMVPMSRMLDAARRANEEALASEGRMSCHISIKELTPFHVGALMYFFFLTIAYEGAMENVNAFDQPGVEDYKKILHEDLRKYIVKNQKEEN
jgi:glucose-6-phosphate isomerase